MTPLDRKPRYELEELAQSYGVSEPSKLTRYELIDALRHKGYREPERGGSRRFARKLFDFASDVAKSWVTLPPPAMLAEIGDEISKRVSEWPRLMTERPGAVSESSLIEAGHPFDLGQDQGGVPQEEKKDSVVVSSNEAKEVEYAVLVKDEVSFDEPLPTKTMGRLLAAQGHSERAIAIFESLAKANPSDDSVAEELRVLRKKHGERKAMRVRIQSVDLSSVLVSWRAEGDVTLRVKEENDQGEVRSFDFDVPARGSRVVGGITQGSMCQAELWQEGQLLLTSEICEHR